MSHFVEGESALRVPQTELRSALFGMLKLYRETNVEICGHAGIILIDLPLEPGTLTLEI